MLLKHKTHRRPIDTHSASQILIATIVGTLCTLGVWEIGVMVGEFPID